MTVDIGTLNAIGTVFVAFAIVGIFAWAYSSHRKPLDQEAANLPFADEAQHLRSGSSDQSTTDRRA